MKTEATKRLGIQHPIIQGPFGGGLSTPRLAATVSNLGGLGSFGAYTNSPEEITAMAANIRALTSAPFALNLWVSTHDPASLQISAEDFERYYRIFEPYFRELGVEKPEPPRQYHQDFEKQVEAILEARPAVFSFIFGVPRPEILAECKRRGIVTSGAATTVAEAELLDAAGVELIVATGFEAGGHRPSFLAPAEDSLMGTFALTQLVADRVRAPVISAGGVADARGVRGALALGASAAQLGTAFLACEESGATAEHRAILHSAAAAKTALSRAYTGRLARGVKNRWLEEIGPRAHEVAPFPVQSWFLGRLRPAAIKAGRTDVVPLWGGQIAPKVRHRSAESLMRELIAFDQS